MSFCRVLSSLPGIVCIFLSSSVSAQFYDDSSFWPPKVALAEALELEGKSKPLPVGRQGVLIRIDQTVAEGDELVVDFGSNGVHRLRPGQTDVSERVEALMSGRVVKNLPNWTMMIGRAFLRVEPEGLKEVRLRDLPSRKHMLIIYAEDLSLDALAPVFANLTKYHQELEARSVLVLLFPVGSHDRKEFQQPLALRATCDFDFYYIYPYLASAYLNSLHHGVDASGTPCVVLVDNEGKTIATATKGGLSEAAFDVMPILDYICAADAEATLK